MLITRVEVKRGSKWAQWMREALTKGAVKG